MWKGINLASNGILKRQGVESVMQESILTPTSPTPPHPWTRWGLEGNRGDLGPTSCPRGWGIGAVYKCVRFRWGREWGIYGDLSLPRWLPFWLLRFLGNATSQRLLGISCTGLLDPVQHGWRKRGKVWIYILIYFNCHSNECIHWFAWLFGNDSYLNFHSFDVFCFVSIRLRSKFDCFSLCQGVYIQMFIILYCLPEHLCCPCLYYTMISNVLLICVCVCVCVCFQVKRNERQEKRELILKVRVKLKPRFDHMLSC